MAFVLACEGGNNRSSEAQLDALAIAYVIRNRMTSGLYRGTADEVVQEQGQFQCWAEGARPGNNLANINNIDPVIRDYASRLVNNDPLPDPFNNGIRFYGLYTFGLYSEDTNRDAFPPATVIDLLSSDDGSGYCSLSELLLSGIYIGIAPYGSRV